MATKADFRIPDFELVEVEMTLRAPVCEWRKISKRLEGLEGGGTWALKDAMAKMLREFEAKFSEYVSPEDA